MSDNRLAYTDQAGLQLMRATGRAQLMQAVWVYEHPVDFDGLKRFHDNLGYGLAGRLIERSPLPFGRCRWVASTGPSSDIDIADVARAREEVVDWADERLALPVDPEWGPGWHVGVLPLTDGSTAISLVMSHYLADGVGFLSTITDAVNGNRRDLGYPMPRSRTRFRGTLTDLRQAAHGAPEVARTLAAAAKIAFRHRHDAANPVVSRPSATNGGDGDSTVVLPAIAIYIDLEKWNTRASSLNGTSYSLLAGIAAKLAERLGRQREDGTVSLTIALNDRTGPDDLRANAMLFARADLEPKPAATDLADVRTAIRHALKTAREVPDEALELLPLVPFVPRRALKRKVEQFLGLGADLPVSLSNMGEVDPAVGGPDGTDAEYLLLRGADQNISRRDIERAGGQLVLVGARFGAKISIGVVAYQADSENSKARLRELAAQTLAELELTGEIV